MKVGLSHNHYDDGLGYYNNFDGKAANLEAQKLFVEMPAKQADV
jgi:hypothetical protein